MIFMKKKVDNINTIIYSVPECFENICRFRVQSKTFMILTMTILYMYGLLFNMVILYGESCWQNI